MTRPVDNDDRGSVVERAQALPDELTPPRDMWPDIERKLSAPADTRWSAGRLAAAAAVLIALSSTFTLFITRTIETPVQVETAVLPSTVSFEPWYVGGTDIVQTRADLLLDVKKELNAHSPEAWEILVTNMNKIEAAREEINAALDGHPDNDLLQYLLFATYTNEVTLLTQVGTMTRPAQQRIEL